MKKIISFILSFSLILPMFFPITAKALDFAEAPETIMSIEYLENGDYIKTILITQNDTETVSTASTSFLKTGSKASIYYNSNQEAMWSITITATFKCVEGESVSLQSYSGSGTSYNSNWKVHDVTARRSSDIAICEGKGTHYFSIVKMETVSAYVDLRCNTYGLLR